MPCNILLVGYFILMAITFALGSSPSA